jgi:hypothetical protein
MAVSLSAEHCRQFARNFPALRMLAAKYRHAASLVIHFI